MYLTTTRTVPLPIRKPKVLLDETATTARLARREPTVKILDRPPVPASLVLQLPLRLVERSVSDSTGEAVVLHHPPHVQRLQVHRLVLTDDLGRRLVQVVFPNVLHLQVHLGEPPLGSLPVLAPLLLAGQPPLYHLDPAAQLPVRLGILVHLAVAARRQRLDAEIDTDFGINRSEYRHVPLHGNRDVVLPCLVPTDRGKLDLAFDFPVLDHPDAFEELRDDQLVLDHLDILWYSERLVAVLFLEDRELAPPGEEIVVRSIQALERELQRLRVHFLHPRQGLFQLGQVFAVPVVVGRFLAAEVLLLAVGEEVVVDVPDRPEVLAEKHSLFLVRVQPKPERVQGWLMLVRHLAYLCRPLSFSEGNSENFGSG